MWNMLISFLSLFLFTTSKNDATHPFCHVTRHEVIHGWHDLRAQRELVLDVKVARKFLYNIGLGAVKKKAGSKGFYLFDFRYYKSVTYYDMIAFYLL
jgi:hypothetical protein